jgi:hypothetical protein
VPALTLTPAEEPPRALLPRRVPFRPMTTSPRPLPHARPAPRPRPRTRTTRTRTQSSTHASSARPSLRRRRLRHQHQHPHHAAPRVGHLRRARMPQELPAGPKSFLPAPRALPALMISSADSIKRCAHVRAGSRSSFTLGLSAPAAPAAMPASPGPVRSPTAELDSGFPASPAPASALVRACAPRRSHVPPPVARTCRRRATHSRSRSLRRSR